MASRRQDERPLSLQLQFIVRGGKRVLPLTKKNVAVVFKTGVLTKFIHWNTFGQQLGIPRSMKDPVTAAAFWLGNGGDRRWRVIIYYLDYVGETDLADELMPYSEPPSDSSLTAEHVTPVFMNTKNWAKMSGNNFVTVIVPLARAEVICDQYQSDHDQRRQGAIYYVNAFPWASWEHLAGMLYQHEEKKATEVFKAQLPKPKDATLTVEIMLQVTDGVEMPEKKDDDDDEYLDMLDEMYTELVRRHGTKRKGRQEIFTEFLSHHPYPRWELVVDLLQALERKGKARAGLAEEVKEKYLTNQTPASENEENTTPVSSGSEQAISSTTSESSSHSQSLSESLSCPNLIELVRFRGRERRINIPREVGTNFRQFGILLLNDPTGSHVESIIHKCRGNPEEVTIEILQDWVQGGGQPLTWKALVETLEDIGLNTLATDIRDVTL